MVFPTDLPTKRECTRTYLNEERLRLMKEYLEAPPKVITCAFPHSIADGESDKLLRELYGGRIHAETRRKGVK